MSASLSGPRLRGRRAGQPQVRVRTGCLCLLLARGCGRQVRARRCLSPSRRRLRRPATSPSSGCLFPPRRRLHRPTTSSTVSLSWCEAVPCTATRHDIHACTHARARTHSPLLLSICPAPKALKGLLSLHAQGPEAQGLAPPPLLHARPLRSLALCVCCIANSHGASLMSLSDVSEQDAGVPRVALPQLGANATEGFAHSSALSEPGKRRKKGKGAKK